MGIAKRLIALGAAGAISLSASPAFANIGYNLSGNLEDLYIEKQADCAEFTGFRKRFCEQNEARRQRYSSFRERHPRARRQFGRRSYGVSQDEIKNRCSQFTGLERRFCVHNRLKNIQKDTPKAARTLRRYGTSLNIRDEARVCKEESGWDRILCLREARKQYQWADSPF